MPAIPSIRLHSRSNIQPGVLSALKPESFLLIESCPVEADGDLYEDKDWKGRLYISVTDNPQIRWNVSAKVRAAAGLANYHPGLPLTKHALAFANADLDDLPFLFKPNTGILFYNRPRFTPDAGRLPSVDFEIVLKFGEYAADRYRSGSPIGLVSGRTGLPAVETAETATPLPPPDPEAPPEEPSPEWEGRLVSFYYHTGAEIRRIARIANAAVNLAAVTAEWDRLSAVDGLFSFAPVAHAGGIPPVPCIYPPVPDEWPAAMPVAFLGAYDHTASQWIGAAVPGVTPEPGAVARFIWLGNGTEMSGPWLYFRDPDSPDELRPAGHDGWTVQAIYTWAGGWTGPAAAALSPYFWPYAGIDWAVV